MKEQVVHLGKYLRFLLLDEHFAVPVQAVREVVQMVACSCISHSSPYVKGAINFHGTIVPVVSGHSRLGLPECEISPDQRLILLEDAVGLTALVVDRVVDVVQLDESTAVETRGSNAWGPCVHGVFWHNGAMVKLITVSEIIVRSTGDLL